MKLTIFLLFVLCLSSGGMAAENGSFKYDFTEIRPGVWTGIRANSQLFPVMGNTTFVVSDEGVVVFDGGGVPAMAEQIIAKIRSITVVPVTNVVISHWHGDHNFGVYRYAEEFPNVQFIAHSFTHAAMSGPRIRYIDGYPGFIEENLENFRMRAGGKDAEGNDINEYDQQAYAGIVRNAEEIDREYKRATVTMPTMVFDDKLVIHSGDRVIELLFLGHGNTAGDIVMWLPTEKVVATGDLVVLPSPYAFNVPPRPWAATLEALKALDYELLVPGHGEVQSDQRYIDLVIESALAVADQRDEMLSQGLSNDVIMEKLDFSAIEPRFTGGDGRTRMYYMAWYEGPFRKAAIKALSGEPMVDIAPEPEPED